MYAPRCEGGGGGGSRPLLTYRTDNRPNPAVEIGAGGGGCWSGGQKSGPYDAQSDGTN